MSTPCKKGYYELIDKITTLSKKLELSKEHHKLSKRYQKIYDEL